jgi:DNA-binding transcriptional ArsR family regulator
LPSGHAAGWSGRRGRSSGSSRALIELSEAGLSKHLRLLARANLVRARREGYYVLYSVDLDRISKLSEVVLLFLAEAPQDAA